MPKDNKERADKAERLLNDPLFKGAVQEVSELFIQEWVNAPARDHEGKEFLWCSVKALNAVVNQLESYVNTGKLETKQTEMQYKT